MLVSSKKLNTLYDSEGSKITLGNEIGRGGEGTVYDVSGRSDLVAKIYSKNITDEKALKLIGMVKNYNAGIEKIAAWPYRTLHQSPNSTPIGFLMKKISDYKDIHELYGVASRKQEFPKADWRFLILSARNLASAVSVVHQNGYIVGDLNDKNILVGSDAIVKLIDCDSYQIVYNDKTFLCEVGVPEYTSPELQGKSFNSIVRTPTHDNFALAVFIFKLLFLARHPFFGQYLGMAAQPSTIAQAIEKNYFYYSKNAALNNLKPPPGTLTIGALSPQISTLFERAFSRDSSKNGGRPSAREWITALDGLQGELKTCTSNPSHIYYKQIHSCPWCVIEANSTVVLFSIYSSTKTLNTSGGCVKVTEVNALWARITNIASPGPAPHINFGLPSTLPLPNPLPTHIATELNSQRTQNTIKAILVAAIEIAVGVFIVASGLWIYLLGFWFIGIFIVFWAISNVSNILVRQPDSQAYRDEREKRSKDLKQAQGKLDDAKKHWQNFASEKRFQDKRLELEKAYNTLLSLDGEYRKELQKLEANRREYQLQKHLEKHLIDRAKLDGIGPGLKAQLASYGIDTAADIISHRVHGVPGFGDVRVSTLMSWRRSLESRFVFNPNQGIDSRDLQALKNKYDQQRYTLTNWLKAGESELLTLKNDILSKRNTWSSQLKNLSEVLAQRTADMKVFSNLHFQTVGQNKKSSAAPFVWVAITLGVLSLFANIGSTQSREDTNIPNSNIDHSVDYTYEDEDVTPIIYFVSGHHVNLRKSSNASSEILSTIPIGQEVTEIERQGEWVHISYTGEVSETTGWISSSFLDTSENIVSILETKIKNGRKKIDSMLIDLVSTEKNLVSKTQELLFVEDKLKEKKSSLSLPSPPVPNPPQILPKVLAAPSELETGFTQEDESITTPVEQKTDSNQEEITKLEIQIQAIEASLQKIGTIYKKKRTQYQTLKQLDDAYVEAYQKLSLPQDIKKLTDNEQVAYIENTAHCGSAGCQLTIKDTTGRVLFSGMSQSSPYFLYYTPNQKFRSFIIKQREYNPYQSGEPSHTKLYVYNETQGLYTEFPGIAQK